MAGRVAGAVLVALIAVVALGGGTATAAPLAFTARTFPLPSGFSSPQNFAVGDLNGDSRPDVVVVGFNGTLGIFLNDGQGGFHAATTIAGACPNAGVITGASGVAIGHFTSSGHADLLVGCDYYTDGFVKYAGNGDGTFQAADRIAPIQAYFGEDSQRQPVYGGLGMTNVVHGTFGSSQAVVWNEWAPGGVWYLCALGDSLIVQDSGTPVYGPACSVYVDANNTYTGFLEFPPETVLGTAAFASPSGWAFTTAPADAGLNVGSLRGATWEGSPSPPVLPGIASIDFEPMHALASPPALLAAGDLNGDGSSEIIGDVSGQLAVYQPASGNDTNGLSILPDPPLFTPSPALSAIYSATVADFDKDGKRDVAVLGVDGASETVVEVAPGDGQGGLGAFQSFKVADFTTEGKLATADFNGDGLPDVATFDAISPSSITVFYSGAASATLTVSKAGSGSGTVSSSPAGISCGSTCTSRVAQGTQVTLTATAAAGSSFTGWSGGGCSGTGTCKVTMSADTTVTATFASIPVCVVPKVKGKKLAAAKLAVTSAHCSVGKITKAFSGTVKRGRVVSQRPKPGTKSAAGAAVKLTVSKGPKPRH